MSGPQPLAGIRVVAFEQAVAGPMASRHLADMGADVIKIERREGGDFARSYDHLVRGQSSHFIWLNRSKGSMALDLKDPADLEVARDLALHADVVIQNLAPGACERLGLDADTLRAQAPGLIHCSISGYGPGGPYEAMKAYDLLVQCEAGVLSITGTEEQPCKTGIPVADIAAGMYAFSGILAALVRRGSTGEGATIEISMLECLAEWMGFPMYYTKYGQHQPPRSGASHAAIAPYGPVPCSDGTVFLSVQNGREWVSLCQFALDWPVLATDPRFDSNSARIANRPQLTELIETITRQLTTSELVERLTTAGIACGRLRSVDELIEHEQLRARQRWRVIDTPAGPVDALLPAINMNGWEPVMGAVPALGQSATTSTPAPTSTRSS